LSLLGEPRVKLPRRLALRALTGGSMPESMNSPASACETLATVIF
jgi:hypothetical protein